MTERNLEELSAGNNAAIEAILARVIFELRGFAPKPQLEPDF